MTVRRMNKITAILLALLMAACSVLCRVEPVHAQVDPSASEEQATAAAAQSDSGSSGSTSGKKKTSGNNSSNASNSNGSSDSSSTNNSDSDSDEDVVDENAFTTQGNARLGDVISDSSTKDFYTIRTENDKTYYLVIDHAGNMDNVYMLSTIDEEDLQDFLDNGGSSGTLILPENTTATDEETAPKTETAKEEPENNRITGIISLAIILIAAGVGAVIFLRRRNAGDDDEEYLSEHMEDDMIPTVNEDDEDLE